MEHGRTHPILIVAAAAVLLFSLLGAASVAFPGGDRVRIGKSAGLERP